jgi:hypothetical protein
MHICPKHKGPMRNCPTTLHAYYFTVMTPNEALVEGSGHNPDYACYSFGRAFSSHYQERSSPYSGKSYPCFQQAALVNRVILEQFPQPFA